MYSEINETYIQEKPTIQIIILKFPIQESPVKRFWVWPLNLSKS